MLNILVILRKGQKKPYIQLEVLNAINTTQSVSMPKPRGGTRALLIYVLKNIKCFGTLVSYALPNIYFDYLNKDV